MRSQTARYIHDASLEFEAAIKHLRAAIGKANNLQGDCLVELVTQAAELRRKTERLSQVVELDAE